LRIPCFFKPGIFEAAYIAAVLECEALRIRETVEFLVDTGASRTTICDKDIIRLGADSSARMLVPKFVRGVGCAANLVSQSYLDHILDPRG